MTHPLRLLHLFGTHTIGEKQRGRIGMLKNLFRIPSSFESDDDRRKRILNFLLIAFIGLAFFIIGLTIFLKITCQCPSQDDAWQMVIVSALTIVVNGILLIANRWSKMSGWLGSLIFVVFLVLAMTQLDKPSELYAGSSMIVWMLPIMIGSLVLRPSAGFFLAGFISALIFFFAPRMAGDPPNYYSMLALFTVALLCWLVMKLLNQSIHDARHQAANIEAILNTVTDGVLVLDLQGNYISANRALLKMIPEDKLKEINNKPLEETLEWKHTVFSVTASLIPGEGTVVVFRDETRRHETDRAKDALLATASHELRTPLGSIMNYIELLLMLTEMGRVNTERFTTYLMRAHENSHRLLGLVNNILDQAQLQAGALDLKLERCNLPALFEKSRQLLANQTKEKNISYSLTIAPEIPEEIMGDFERLHQVLHNLIGNAIKFTNKGGVQVTVSLPRQDTLSIEVADTGPGIPKEQLPDIFEVFRRGSNYAQREHQGAGLGLSITRELIHRMGGEITVVSNLGVGSVFTVSLPLQLPPSE